MTRLLFIASLHHPEVLVAERAAARQQGQPMPLFPTSYAYHFYERVLLARGYTLEVFWRNLPATAGNNPTGARSQRFEAGITPRKVWQALAQRVPPAINPALRARNAALLAAARRFQPHIIWLTGDNRDILPSTLARLKEAHGCRLIYASGTSPIVFSSPIEREAARLYDDVLVNDYYHGIQWQELGAPRMRCLPIAAIDPQFHAPRTSLSEDEKQRYRADISFVGTLLPASLYSERVAALAALADMGLGIWSVHGIPTALRPAYRGEALGDAMMRVLCASQMTVNPHGDFMRYGGNMRLFEAAALGVFQLVDNRPGIREWFTPGEHLITYDDPQDLREKARYYLAHPEERARIAAAAQAHAHQHHTYAHRVEALAAAGILR
jgi:hypothetical protein